MARWSEDDIPWQSGRAALVTGANSGLGLRTAEVLAAKGAHVFLGCRNRDRGELAAATVSATGGRAELVHLDLADLTSVRAAADEVRRRTGDRLHLLINNAGVMMTPYRQTRDGFELQFGTNHVGHAALTWLLMPAMRRATRPRVVALSSVAARSGKINATDPNFEHRGYRPGAAYAQSKLANLLFALELDRRARGAGVDLASVAAHPGYTATELTANMGHAHGVKLIEWVGALGNALLAQNVANGALPQLFAATALDVHGGDFIGPGGFRELRGSPERVPLRNAAGREHIAEELWEMTAALTGITPEPP